MFLYCRDLYDLNLFELKRILVFIGFEPKANIYEFNLTEFMLEVRNMMRLQNITIAQQKFVGYFINCERRVVPNSRIVNKRYRPVSRKNQKICT